MWKHSHLNVAYAVYLDPTKGKPNAVPSHNDRLDPPDAIFSNKADAEQWIERNITFDSTGFLVSSGKEYPLAVILTIENAWLPTWTNTQNVSVLRPYPLPDFLIESIGQAIIDTTKRTNNETR